MKITIFGTGYVGLVTGLCFADVGNHVTCVDVNLDKLDMLRKGISPIYEPGIENLLKRNIEKNYITFTNEPQKAIESAEIIFIAVGTPEDEDGSVDLKYVLNVADTISKHINDCKVIVNKSTVPIGTAEKVLNNVKNQLSARNKKLTIDVVSNPEFLKEGAAIEDFVKPDRIVVGADSDKARSIMRALYTPFNRNHDRLLLMDIRSAELTKYAANAMLATKISFMNEVSNIAERVGADIETVRLGIGSDPRIGYHFIYPGCGYGGSCFPKDVKALAQIAIKSGHKPELLDAVERVNERQKNRLVEMVLSHFGEDLTGKCFGIWGLSFKPNTDDMREAPSLVVIKALSERGATIRAYDPVAKTEAQQHLGDNASVEFVDDLYDAVHQSDALLLLTEWKEFRAPDFDQLEQQLISKVIFDGRNVFDPKVVAMHNLSYYSIGRRPVLTEPQ